MDGILDTVSASHPISPLLDLLRTNGKLILVGAPVEPLELSAMPLLLGKWAITGVFLLLLLSRYIEFTELNTPKFST